MTQPVVTCVSVRQLAASLVLALWMVSAPLHAAAPDDSGASDGPVTPPAAEPAQPAPPAEGAAARGDDTTQEVFIPSEEISEDFTVSFPVDI